MNRAQKYLAALPVGTCSVKTIETEWGLEGIYRSPDGKEHFIPKSKISDTKLC
tara:strand:- start:274 stop:432 length:159 start_codon:yes stop_codon:yes gene_type:complete